MAPEPQRFGKYQIIERIASGGMAEVFKARLEGIGGFHRTYAIKRILPHLTSNAEFVDLLVDEAKVAGLLSHANIVQILDLGVVDDQYFIAMEYVNGLDLGQVLQRCAEKRITLPVPHAAYILTEILKGLEYAHNRTVVRNGVQVPLHIVHRDISPANLLVSVQGEVKLTDFGIAKAIVKGLETQAGVVKGRFDYMAPEQAAGGAVDARADLFAAGVVFYELLTGRHPFRRGGDARTLEAVRGGEFEPPSRINPDVPPALDRVVARALQVDPGRRYPSATAFKEDLNQFFHDAGFIFSAATLASFLKGLTQTAAPPAARPSDQDTGPMLRSELRASATPLPSRLPAPDTMDATLIRTPVHEALELDPEPPSQWSDLETAIRPDPAPRALPPPSVGRAVPPPPRPPRLPAPSARPVEPARPPARTLTESRPRVVYHTPNHVHLAYVAACFATLLVGLGFGVLIARNRAAGAPPSVEIRAPAGYTAALNGAALTGPAPWNATLTADVPAVVRVQGPGYGPVEARVQLKINEARVLDFTPPALSKVP